MQIHWRVALSITLLVASACSCRQADDHDVIAERMNPEKFLVLRDDLGREVAIARPVRRIVSLAPACTETLFAIGAGEQVVGVTTFDTYPPEATKKEKVGGFARETISVEKIVHLKPDVIFSSGSLQRELVDDLEALGLVVFAMEPTSYERVIQSIELAGNITGHESAAKRVADRLRGNLEQLQREIVAIPESARPTVFYQVWDKPLRSAGPRSFIGHLLELAGGRNILADNDEAYPLVSEEIVIQRDPQIILAPDHGNVNLDSFASRPAWQRVSAVRANRIYFLNEDVVSRPGPRVDAALQMIAWRLYPDRFEGPQPATESQP